MVLHVGRLCAGDAAYVLADLRAVVAAARVHEADHPERGRVLVKVILECALLTEQAKLTACRLVEEAGADMLKVLPPCLPASLPLLTPRPLRARRAVRRSTTCA